MDEPDLEGMLSLGREQSCWPWQQRLSDMGDRQLEHLSHTRPSVVCSL